jgi:hypothetical protein
MAIDSRSIVGAAGTLALVGAVMWGFTVLFSPPEKQPGGVEITQLSDPAEVRQLGTEPADTLTASR